MKLQKTAPTNKQFAGFFYQTIAPTKTVKFIAQVISAITSGATLFVIVANKLHGILSPTSVQVLAAIIAILTAVFIEKGLNSTLPTLVRQIARKAFADGFYKAMFIPILLLTVLFGSATTVLSLYGSQEIAENATPKPKTYDLVSLAQTNETREIAQAYEQKQQNLAILHKQQKNIMHAKYEALIAQQQQTIITNTKKQQNGHKWAGSHITKAENKIASLQVQETKAMTKLQTKQSKEVNNLHNNEQKEKEQSVTKTDTLLVIAQSQNAKTNAMIANKQKRYGSIFLVLTMCSVIVVFCCVVLIEVYEAGAGVQTIAEPTKPFFASILSPLQSLLLSLLPQSLQTVINSDNSRITTKPNQSKIDDNTNNNREITYDFSNISKTDIEDIIKVKRQRLNAYKWKLKKGEGRTENNQSKIEHYTAEITRLSEVKQRC